MIDRNELLNKLNKCLLDSEDLACSFLPLEETLSPIKNDYKNILNNLKEKSETASDISDKVFYINRYTDMVKRLESIFDTRNKRLQQSISLISKQQIDNPITTTQENSEQLAIEDNKLSPEQANEILKILNGVK